MTEFTEFTGFLIAVILVVLGLTGMAYNMEPPDDTSGAVGA